jgi:hypothetical protein
MIKRLLSCSLVLFAQLTLRAGIYQQSPGHIGGFLSDQSLTVADDFVLGRDTKVRAITWWGEDDSDPSANFKVRLFSDNEGQLGVLLAELDSTKISKRATGGFLTGRLYPEVQFTILFSQAFLAKAGVRYWLSVENVSPNQWMWEASGSQQNLGVQRTTDAINGPWTPVDFNTAFLIGAAPLRTRIGHVPVPR